MADWHGFYNVKNLFLSLKSAKICVQYGFSHNVKIGVI